VNPNGVMIKDNELSVLGDVCNNMLIILVFKKIDIPDVPIYFSIAASENKEIEPPLTDYRIPIYITADKDVSDAFIDKLTFSMLRGLFFPKGVIGGSGSWNFSDTINFTLSNISVPSLTAGKTTELC
jgi:hypothetical protein